MRSWSVMRSRLVAARRVVSQTRIGWWLWRMRHFTSQTRPGLWLWRMRHFASQTRLGWWLWMWRLRLWRRLRAVVLPTFGHVAVSIMCPGRARFEATWHMCRSIWTGGELGVFTVGNLPTSVSDPKVIRWHTSSFSYVGDLIDLDFFGLQRRRFRDVAPILVLFYVSALKLLGYVPQATAIYRSLTRRRGRLAAYGWIGLGDIAHTIALWRRLVDAYDARGLTLFPLVGGLNTFLRESMGWDVALHPTLDDARTCYATAIDVSPELAFGWHELARLEADAENYAAAAEAMTEFASRIAAETEETKKSSRLAAELEAARLRALAAAPDIDADDAAMLRRWHQGQIRVVSTVPRRDAVHDTASSGRLEELPVSFRAYWRGREHTVEKNLSFAPIGSHILADGFVSAYTGAPAVTKLDETLDSLTTYPFYPGREIFSPLFLGRANDYELYVARTTTRIRNAVVLPGFSDNYFHFLFDAIGALALVDEEVLDSRKLVLFSHGLKPFQREIFERLGISRRHIRVQRPGRYAVAAKNVVVVDFPTPFAGVHPRTVPFLRTALLGEEREPTPKKRLYLERTGTRRFGRRTRRELHAVLSRYGFGVVHPEKLTVGEQIELIRDAEAIAVDAGAGAANLLFAPAGAKVFLLGPLIGYMDAFTPLCAIANLDLHVVLSEARVHPKYLFTWSALEPEADAKTLDVSLRRAFD